MNKKILLKIIIVLSVISIFINYKVYAVESKLELSGNDKIQIGESKIIELNLSSELDIGVISGNIKKNSNISDIKVSGKNNWNLTYNSENGDFNIVNAVGEKSGSVLEIEYSINSSATGIAEITLSNLKLVSIDYTKEEISEIKKQIEIEQPKYLENIEITKLPNKINYVEGENILLDGIEITANYSDGTKKIVTDYLYNPQGNLSLENDTITISYTEENITKTVDFKMSVEKKDIIIENDDSNQNNENIVNEDQTIIKIPIPAAGIKNYIIIFIIIVIFFGIWAYKKIKKYKGI